MSHRTDDEMTETAKKAIRIALSFGFALGLAAGVIFGGTAVFVIAAFT